MALEDVGMRTTCEPIPEIASLTSENHKLANLFDYLKIIGSPERVNVEVVPIIIKTKNASTHTIGYEIEFKIQNETQFVQQNSYQFSPQDPEDYLSVLLDVFYKTVGGLDGNFEPGDFEYRQIYRGKSLEGDGVCKIILIPNLPSLNKLFGDSDKYEVDEIVEKIQKHKYLDEIYSKLKMELREVARSHNIKAFIEIIKFISNFEVNEFINTPSLLFNAYYSDIIFEFQKTEGENLSYSLTLKNFTPKLQRNLISLVQKISTCACNVTYTSDINNSTAVVNFALNPTV